MSKKLYYDDSFMKEFDGKVVSCRQGKKGWEIILDQTAFYPEGGGQPADHGVMVCGETEVNVLDVHEKNGEVVHYTDSPLEIGSEIHGTIDWDRRFDFMQQHTGEHMFSGIAHSMFGANNVGFHLSERENVVDLDVPLTKTDMNTIMDVCNEIVWKNQPVTAAWPDNLDEIEYRSKKALEGPVRILTAGEADVCACCGTHVKFTSQAGPILAITLQAYKGGTRIHLACGKRAVDYLRNRKDDCFEISHALSTPVEEITTAVSQRIKESDDTKFALGRAKRELMAIHAEKAETDGDICVMVMHGISSQELQTLALMLSKRADTGIACCLKKGENGKICIVSKTKDTNKLGRHISGVLGGKGGGKPGIYQGFIEKETDENRLKELYKSFE